MFKLKAEEDELVDEFFQLGIYEKDEIAEFLIKNLVHAGLYADYGRQVVQNLVDITYEYFTSLEEQHQRAHFLRVLIKLTWIAFSLKRWAFNLSRKDAAKEYANAPLFFAYLTNLTDPLESIRRELAEVDRGLLIKRLILVEGSSEASFLETIQLSSDLLNFDFDVYSFGGKGNITNLVHLIKEKNRQGIRVDLSYDLDGKSDDFQRKLAAQCKVETWFAFTRDFESAFPSRILSEAANRYLNRFTKSDAQVTPEQMEVLLRDPLPFVDALGRDLRVKIRKPKFGAILAELAWADDVLFRELTGQEPSTNEISRFMRFVMVW